MIKINEVVIVEGKHDKIRLSQVIDAYIIPTNGFGIFKNKEQISLLRALAPIRGLLILTDSDSAGMKIRGYISGCVEQKYVKHAYIPDIFGKERRKEQFSKEQTLGVEGMSDEILLQAVQNAGINAKIKEKQQTELISNSDFYVIGLSGRKDSVKMREKLTKSLNLPQKINSKNLLVIINIMYERDEFFEIVEKLFIK